MKTIKGQSIIEYSALVVLIIVAITVMGPYVLRSINAHFKLWQEAIDDSVNDRMLKVPMVKISGETFHVTKFNMCMI